MAVFPVKQWEDDDDEANKGKFGIWTTEADNFVALDLTSEEVVQYFVDQAAQDARDYYESLIENMTNDNATFPNRQRRRNAFYDKPSMTYEQRLERHREMEKNLKNEEINALVRKKLEALDR